MTTTLEKLMKGYADADYRSTRQAFADLNFGQRPFVGTVPTGFKPVSRHVGDGTDDSNVAYDPISGMFDDEEPISLLQPRTTSFTMNHPGDLFNDEETVSLWGQCRSRLLRRGERLVVLPDVELKRGPVNYKEWNGEEWVDCVASDKRTAVECSRNRPIVFYIPASEARGIDNPKHPDHWRYHNIVNRVGIVGALILYWIAFTMALTDFRTFDLALGLAAITLMGLGYLIALAVWRSFGFLADTASGFVERVFDWFKGY